MTAKQRVVIAAGLTLIAAACTARPRSHDVGPSIVAQVETVAPQTIAPGPVTITVAPSRLRSGSLTIRTSHAGAGRPFTASYAWLDTMVDGRWETAWLLANGVSMPLSRYAAGGVALTSDAVGVPGTLTFAVDPAPPPGRYRIRMEIVTGTAAPGTPPPTGWVSAELDVVA